MTPLPPPDPQNILAGGREERGPEEQRAGRSPSTEGEWMPIKHSLVTYCVPKAQDGSTILYKAGNPNG